MKAAETYARALHLLVTKNPSQGKIYARNVVEALKRRHHERLSPNVLAEYTKLETCKERAEKFSKVTPERERTRILLELYRRLVNSHE